MSLDVTSKSANAAPSYAATEAGKGKGGRWRLNLFGLQSKLIIPYIVLTLVVAGFGTYVVTRLVTSSLRERFVNQLYEASRVAADGVVRHERTALEDLRLLTFAAGAPAALQAGDADALEAILLPLVVNTNLDYAAAIGAGGYELLTLSRVADEPGVYRRASGRDFSAEPFVARALLGESDEQGDKFIGLLETQDGWGLFLSAPVYLPGAAPQDPPVGALLVGVDLARLLGDMKTQSLADLALFDGDGRLLAATLPDLPPTQAELLGAAQGAAAAGLPVDLQLYNRDYAALSVPFQARNQTLGEMVVLLPANFVVTAEVTNRNVFILIFTLGTLGVIVIGLLLARNIAGPVLHLRDMSQAVAAGDLDQNSGLQRADEIGELSLAFDQMTLALRERTAEAERLYAETLRRNAELAEINARLQTMQLQLVQSEKLAAVGQLTAGIVHDVKNPLTVIKGMAEILQSDESIDAEPLRLIHESADKANKIVTDLLKFARQTKPNREVQDLRTAVQAAQRLTDYLARQAHVKIVTEMPDHAVLLAYDAQQIEQVLINLIANALQATQAGGQVCMKIVEQEAWVKLVVADNGCGIEPENLSRIFDPFFTTKPPGEGTGLGLSVSYGMIAGHGGRIEAESRVGEGSIFSVWLPLDATDR